MDLYIVEINAHLAGHYSKELTDFVNTISSEFNSIKIITPFGLKEYFNLQPNIKIVSVFNSVKLINYSLQLRFYFKVFQYVKKKQVILHFWGYKSVLPLFLASFINKRKSDFITLKDIKRNRVGIFQFKILGLIQIKVSDHFLKRLSRFYIVHNDRIFEDAINIGIDGAQICLIKTGIESAKKAISKDIARKFLKLESEDILILFFGVIREEKGIYEILKLSKYFDNKIKLLIVGENWLDKKLKELADDLEIKDKLIIFDKYVNENDLDYYFNAADITLIYHRPSFKGESGVLLKAIAYDLPSITHQLNSAAKIIEENKIGEVCKYLDSNNLNEKIELILEQKKIYIENMIKYREKNSFNKMKSEYFSIYKKVIN